MNYPFAAIVGQERLKRVLMLCAINPSIGGVLIRGEKGTAKSTAVRGLAEIVPPILKVADCAFNCSRDEVLDICQACQHAEAEAKLTKVPFVNLPLGASEDRVIGSLDLESVLSERKKKLQPGLLASAHRGILYIDEVNLLADHLVDVLLDVAAMGVNTVQREGLSVSHPAQFTLIGTMNPEEGNLRPQFLDRFGLMIDVKAPRDIVERTEVVRRRIAFEKDPTAFLCLWEPNQTQLQRQLLTAKELLPSVALPDGLLTLISQLCTELGVVSLRADIVIYKTALTLAALANRMEVTADDVREAAELALLHRQRNKPFEENKLKKEELIQQNSPQKKPTRQSEIHSQPEHSPATNTNSQANEEESQRDVSEQEEVFGVTIPSTLSTIEVEYREKNDWLAQSGRRSQTRQPQRGQSVRTVADTNPRALAVQATLQHALIREPNELQIKREDFHQHIRTGKTSHLILFVVDASGSMAASRRMEAVKGSVLSLLTDAYQRRDTVGVIAFRGIEAQVLLEPTRSVELAEQAMRDLPTGGRTPLPHALQLVIQVLHKFDHPDASQPLVVILSDGKANVPLPSGGDAWAQTMQLAAQLQESQLPAIVLDTNSSYLQLGKANELARALGADYLPLEELSAESITRTISNKLPYSR